MKAHLNNDLAAMNAAPRWRVGLVTAAVHGLLLAGLFAAGGGGQAPTAALQAVAVRLLALESPAAPPAMPIVAPPPATVQALPRPVTPLPVPPVELAMVAMEPPAAGAPAPLAAPAPVPTAAPAVVVVAVATVAVAVRPHATPNRPASRSHCPAADYPALLRERGVEGLVRVRVQVGAQGEALAVQLAAGSGFRLLDEAALAQARACRYQAALQDGAAVASWVEFPSRFSLQ